MPESRVKHSTFQRNPILSFLSRILPYFAVFFAVFLMVRWWFYIDSYSVNVLFQDQWDLCTHVLSGSSWKDLFFVQHGPHRQGVGFIITRIVIEFSGWNTRTEAFTIGGLMVVASVLGIIAKRFLIGKWEWTDVFFAIVFLSPMHWELFGLTPNPAHGSGPLLLMMVYFLSYLTPLLPLRYLFILITNYLLIYTGFGVFAGVITPVILLLETVRFIRSGNRVGYIVTSISLFISLLSIGSFFHGYMFLPANPDFVFPLEGWWYRYPRFAFLVLANFCGLKIQTVGMPAAQIVGGGFFLIMTYVAVFHLLKLFSIREDTSNPKRTPILSSIVLFFVTFTLVFVVNTSIGRAGFWEMSSQASRYLAYIVPGALGIYLHFAGRKYSNLRSTALAVLVIVMVAATLPMRKSDRVSLAWTHRFKTKWVEVYLETEDIQKADEAAGFAMYPNPKATGMKGKLDKFKARGENLFLNKK